MAELMRYWAARAAGWPWLHKAARTGLAVLPGLVWWAAGQDVRGTILAFAALCFSVPYADQGLRPWQMLAMGLAGALLLPGAQFVAARPLLCVPAIMLLAIGYVLIRRVTRLPVRLSTYLLIFLLYEGTELDVAGIAPSLMELLVVITGACWAVFVCFGLWPWRGRKAKTAAGPGPRAKKAMPASMSVPRQAFCTALAAGAAAAIAFACDRGHANWAIWSAITVVQSGAQESLIKCGRRVAGGAVGCAIGFALLLGLAHEPWLLDSVTALLVLLMVAFETYLFGVGVRSALAVLAAVQLGGDAVASGLARIESIAIGVVIALLAVLLLAPKGSWAWQEVRAAWRLPSA